MTYKITFKIKKPSHKLVIKETSLRHLLKIINASRSPDHSRDDHSRGIWENGSIYLLPPTPNCKLQLNFNRFFPSSYVVLFSETWHFRSIFIWDRKISSASYCQSFATGTSCVRRHGNLLEGGKYSRHREVWWACAESQQGLLQALPQWKLFAEPC